MTTNIGFADRTIRMIAGVAVLSTMFFLEGQTRWFSLLGLIPLLTVAFGYCPLYGLLGVNTCGRKD